MARIIIIGAGLTGLSAAYHLEKKGFHDYLILEKAESPGGLCASIQHDGFTFDYTGHLLHINDPYFKEFITSLIGFDFFNRIDRKAYIHSHNQYTPYPYQINLYGLPPTVIIDCIKGFVERNHNQQQKTFKDWVLAQFGSGFANHFFIPYQEKIFSYPIDKITASWTSRFVPATSLHDILHGTLKQPIPDAGYNAQFYYPKCGGILSWVLKIADALINPIITNCTVTKIDTTTKTVVTLDGDHIPYDYLINTMPLDILLQALIEKPTLDCKKASQKLLCNSVFNFNLGINKPNISDKHWIYYPEKKYPFYRLGFPHNLSSSMTPPQCSSLSGEIAFLQTPSSVLHEMYRTALHHIKKEFNFTRQNIIAEKIIMIPHAYVIFDFWREKNITKLLTRLEEESIYSIGRYGAWKYASMQESVLDGKKIADTITILPARIWDYPSHTINLHAKNKLNQKVKEC